MRVVVAPDKFKESATAQLAAEAMARLREVQPNISVEWIERYVPYTPRAMPHFLAGMRKAGLD